MITLFKWIKKIITMPTIAISDIDIYYEILGKGPSLLFIHGGWVSRKMWAPQVKYFSANYQVITCDIRGHGRTGGSLKKRYSMELFASDIVEMLEKLQVNEPIIVGLSMGGMVAQVLATKYSDYAIKALILSDTAISSELTFNDKLLKYLFAPKWLFLLIVRLLGVKRYANFAFWFAKKSRGEKWVGEDESIIDYEKEEMNRFDVKEFNKIFSAIYDYKIQDLSKVKVPTLLINGEFESKSVFQHANKMNELIEHSTMKIIANAGHTSNMENPDEFNRVLAEFLLKN